MTLEQLRNMVNSQTDNEFDTDEEFLSILNIIIADININMSSKFNTIDVTEVDFTKTLEELTGIPELLNIIIISGTSWKLQMKEDEFNYREHQAIYKMYVNKYKHLVPNEYKLEDYNDIIFRTNDKLWEID